MRIIPWLITVISAIWITGNVLLAVVAYIAFDWVQTNPELITRAGAGAVFGSALAQWAAIVSFLLIPLLIALGCLAGTAVREKRRNVALCWILLMAFCWGTHAVNHQGISDANALAAEIRAEKAKPSGDPAALNQREIQFAALHQASTRWHTVESLLALGLLIGGSIGVLRKPRAISASSPAPVAH